MFKNRPQSYTIHIGFFLVLLCSVPLYADITVGASALFGLGFGTGEGADLARAALTETGSVKSLAAGHETWQADLFARLPLNSEFDAIFDIAVGPVAFAVSGFNDAGKAVESRSYSYYNMDIAALASYQWKTNEKIILDVAAGLFAGVRVSDGLVLLRSEGLESRYTVPAETMSDDKPGISFGGIIQPCCHVPLGPGFVDAGIKLFYRFSSVQGFLSDDFILAQIITPYIFAGYSIRIK